MLEAPDLTVAGSSTGGFMIYPGKSGNQHTVSLMYRYAVLAEQATMK